MGAKLPLERVHLCGHVRAEAQCLLHRNHLGLWSPRLRRLEFCSNI